MLRQGGKAVYNHSAGAYNGCFLTVADNSTKATYNISGSATTNLTGEYLIAFFAPSSGVTNQSGGTIAAAGNARIGVDGVGLSSLLLPRRRV